MSDIWVERVHEDYAERARRDQYTEDHYTGAVKDKSITKAKKLVGSTTSEKDDLYLFRRAQGESIVVYTERVQISKFPRHDAAIVDSFSGSVFAVENKADRTLEAFGDIDDESSFAYRLWRNADGQGTNYCTMFKKAAGNFTNYKRVWYLVETETFQWLHGASVKNWFYDDDGILSDVLIEEVIDDRTSIQDEYGNAEDRRRWIHYHKEGFDRYKITNDGKGERRVQKITEESGSWDYAHYDGIDQEHITIPLGFIDLPFADNANPGYSMAQDANYLYNLLSDIRNTLRVANHPKLRGKDVTDEEFENTEESLQKGSNLLQGDWDFISPSPENAQTGYEIYKEEVRDFFVTSHQRYNDAAREATATEARQDDQAGRQAYLIILSGALDELEGRVLFMLSQKQFPLDSGQWLINSVTRSTDFKAEDSNQFADKLMKTFFSGPVPIGATGLNNVAKKVAGLLGVEIEEDELDEDISSQETERKQEEAANTELEQLLNA